MRTGRFFHIRGAIKDKVGLWANESVLMVGCCQACCQKLIASLSRGVAVGREQGKMTSPGAISMGWVQCVIMSVDTETNVCHSKIWSSPQKQSLHCFIVEVCWMKESRCWLNVLPISIIHHPIIVCVSSLAPVKLSLFKPKHLSNWPFHLLCYLQKYESVISLFFILITTDWWVYKMPIYQEMFMEVLYWRWLNKQAWLFQLDTVMSCGHTSV